MRKCNVCGKTISDFATQCPYCNSAMDAPTNSETIIRKAHYQEAHAKVNILISMGLSCLLIIFFGFAFRMPLFSLITVIELILEVACAGYSLFVIINYKTFSFSKNKACGIIALIAGMIFAILLGLMTYRLYGIGCFAIKNFPIVYKFAGVLTYIMKGVLLSFVILDIHFLLYKKHSTAVRNEDRHD